MTKTVDMETGWRELYRARRTTAEEAFKDLRSGSRIFLGSGCGEPLHLTEALAKAADRLNDVEVVQVVSVARGGHSFERYPNSFRTTHYFVVSGSRQAVSEGRAEFTPMYLSDVPIMLSEKRLLIDAALIQVTPPDEHGYVSLGVSVEATLEAVDQARVVIAQVNPRMPRTLGDSFIHVEQITHLVEQEEPLISYTVAEPNQAAKKIGRIVARHVPDGATIHCGIGRLPQAVLGHLTKKKNLGVHTDVLTDAYVDLARAGVITGSAKKVYPKKIVASFCLGSEKLFEFVHNNPGVEMQPVRVTNDPSLIAQNNHMVTVHEALEVDLTGQVCADAVGRRMYSGVGGMIDFLRGTARCPGGQSIMVLTSTRPDGSSRLVPTLSDGAGVGVTRAGVRTIITEYGAAYIHGMSLRDRALALIDIAHPNHRDALLTAAQQLGLIGGDQIMAPLFTGVYPEGYDRIIYVGEDERIFTRPVRPTDERLVQEFFYAMTDREVYYRFLHGIKAFPRKDMQRMVNIDYHREMTVLGLTGEFGNEKVAGLARYVLGSNEVPEVDFAVRTDFQGKGLGKALTKIVVEIARDRGYKGVGALVMSDNMGSLNILYNLGYAVEGTVSQGVIEIFVDFSRPVTEKTVELSYDQPKPRQESLRDEPLSRI